MAVRASNYALRDLRLRLRDALGVADVQCLAAGNVIEMKGSRMKIESTIDATRGQLVGVKPATDFRCARVGLLIDALPISSLTAPTPYEREPEMRIELADCENTLLSEIADKAFKRKDIALTYSMAMASSEGVTLDWGKVNRAIISRWSVSGLLWIKKEAHKPFRLLSRDQKFSDERTLRDQPPTTPQPKN